MAVTYSLDDTATLVKEKERLAGEIIYWQKQVSDQQANIDANLAIAAQWQGQNTAKYNEYTGYANVAKSRQDDAKKQIELRQQRINEMNSILAELNATGTSTREGTPITATSNTKTIMYIVIGIVVIGIIIWLIRKYKK